MKITTKELLAIERDAKDRFSHLLTKEGVQLMIYRMIIELTLSKRSETSFSKKR